MRAPGCGALLNGMAAAKGVKARWSKEAFEKKFGAAFAEGELGAALARVKEACVVAAAEDMIGRVPPEAALIGPDTV